MATEIPDPEQAGEPDRTTPVPSAPPAPTAPIETLYAADPASMSRRPESVAGAPATPAERAQAVAVSEATPAASAAEAPPATAEGASPAAPGGARWAGRGRWSGRRTAAVAALAFVLGGIGAVAVAAALPDGGRSASVGDRTTGVRGQLPGGLFPGAPHDHADPDGDDDGAGGRDFRGGQPPQGGLPGGQHDANGGSDSDI